MIRPIDPSSRPVLGVLGAVITVLAMGCAKPTTPAPPVAGFTPIVPPSTLIAPGSIVYIREAVPLTVGTVCTPSVAFGDNLVLSTSKAPSYEGKKAGSVSLKAIAAYLSVAQLNSAQQSIESISYAMDNVSIIEVTDSTILERADVMTEACKKAVRAKVQAGKEVTLIRQVASGDCEFTFNASTTHGAEITASDISAVTAALGATRSTSNAVKAVARSLVIGVVDDRDLLCAAVEGLCSGSTTSKGDARVLPALPVIISPPKADP